MTEFYEGDALDAQIEESPIHQFFDRVTGLPRAGDGVRQLAEQLYVPAEYLPLIHNLMIARGQFPHAFLYDDEFDTLAQTQNDLIQQFAQRRQLTPQEVDPIYIMYRQFESRWMYGVSPIHAWDGQQPRSVIESVIRRHQTPAQMQDILHILLMARGRFGRTLTFSELQEFQATFDQEYEAAMRRLSGGVPLPREIIEGGRIGIRRMLDEIVRAWAASL